jgi:hypothetical protein
VHPEPFSQDLDPDFQVIADPDPIINLSPVHSRVHHRTGKVGSGLFPDPDCPKSSGSGLCRTQIHNEFRRQKIVPYIAIVMLWTWNDLLVPDFLVILDPALNPDPTLKLSQVNNGKTQVLHRYSYITRQLRRKGM